jgi:outer membrane surface antigen
VVALAPSALSRQPLYRGRSRRWHAALALPPLFALALALGGCSFSYQLDNMFSKKDDSAQTTSLRPAPARTPLGPPHEADLAIARAAVSEVLAKGGKDTSMPWENPKTGARGTITPLAQAYSQDGTTCRDFLASYVRDGNESWLQGEACRAARGKWEVRNMRPWKST